MSGLPNLVASKVVFVESGTYQAPVLRTYKTNYNDLIIKDYLRDTQNGNAIVPNALNNISSAILTPSAQIDGYVNIENGWTERRLTFLMEILVPDRFSANPRSIVLTGYTDHSERTLVNKMLDPNMKVYFNTSTVLTNMQYRSANGAMYNKKVMMDSSHLLNANVMRNIVKSQQQTYQDHQLWYATPRNVIYEMSNMYGADTGAYPGLQGDFRTQSNELSIDRSRLDNTVPSTYLSKILRGVNDHMSKLDTGGAVDEIDALSNASAAVREQDVSVDGVMVALSMFDNSFYLQHGYITWGQLERMIPNIDAVTAVTNRGNVQRKSALPDAVAGNFASWQGANSETLIVARVAQLLPAIMTSSMVAVVTIAFTNDNLTLTPEVRATYGQSLIDGLEFVDIQSQMITRFINEVVPTITDQNRSIVNMLIQYNFSTETFINISRNGEPPVPYCVPTFCDAMYTPILGTNKQQLTNIASDLQNIANSVSTTQFKNNWVS